MDLSLHHLLILLVFLLSAFADFLGPSYPPPTDLSSNHSLVTAGWQKVTSTLDLYLKSQNSSIIVASLKNVTFSIGLFSLQDPAATKLQFHYTSPEVASAPNGTQKVDGDSIYRLASISKLFTVLAGLLVLKDTDWDRPLTDIIPEFGALARKHSGENNSVDVVEWDSVTPSALAAQIAGIPRDLFLEAGGDILANYWIALATGQPSVDPTIQGYPPSNTSDAFETPPCLNFIANGTACPADLFVQSVYNQLPTFPPWTSPGYSDVGFALLCLAISNITGKSMEQIYRESVFNPLCLSSTNSSNPPESEWPRSVIPAGLLSSFIYPEDLFGPSGRLSSTTNDLAKLGVAILNSTLLSPDQTRRWMKPVTFTDRLEYAVGRPWEIMRYQHPSGHITDIYPKSGDSGTYSSWIALLPDYDVGFTILMAGTSSSRYDVAALIADVVTNAILPALQAQAGIEAGQKFGGTYKSSTPGLNSSLTLISNQTMISAPGLAISSWISNGTDMLDDLSSFATPGRLLPTKVDRETGQQAFRLVGSLEAPSAQVPGQLFSGSGYLGSDWIDLDTLGYGGLPVGLQVFDVSTNGTATAVTLPALRITLEKILV